MTAIEKVISEIVKALLEGGVRHDSHYQEPLPETSPWIFRCACGALLDKNGQAWEQKDYWLASLVVGIVEERRKLHGSFLGGKGGLDPETQALLDLNISPSDYEEIKRRVEK